VSQFIKFGDLTANEESRPVLLDPELTLVPNTFASSLSFSTDEVDGIYTDTESRLTDEEEDALLRVSLSIVVNILLVSIPGRTQQVVSQTGSPASSIVLSNYWKISQRKGPKAQQVAQLRASPYNALDMPC